MKALSRKEALARDFEIIKFLKKEAKLILPPSLVKIVMRYINVQQQRKAFLDKRDAMIDHSRVEQRRKEKIPWNKFEDVESGVIYTTN